MTPNFLHDAALSLVRNAHDDERFKVSAILNSASELEFENLWSARLNDHFVAVDDTFLTLDHCGGMASALGHNVWQSSSESDEVSYRVVWQLAETRAACELAKDFMVGRDLGLALPSDSRQPTATGATRCARDCAMSASRALLLNQDRSRFTETYCWVGVGLFAMLTVAHYDLQEFGGDPSKYPISGDRR